MIIQFSKVIGEATGPPIFVLDRKVVPTGSESEQLVRWEKPLSCCERTTCHMPRVLQIWVSGRALCGSREILREPSDPRLLGHSGKSSCEAPPSASHENAPIKLS